MGSTLWTSYAVFTLLSAISFLMHDIPASCYLSGDCLFKQIGFPLAKGGNDYLLVELANPANHMLWPIM